MEHISKTTISIALSMFILAALAFFALPSLYKTEQKAQVNTVKSTAGMLVADTSAFDLGTVSMAKGLVNYSFKIKNIGATPVALSTIYTSCMCTTATLKKNGQAFGPFGMPGHVPLPLVDQTMNGDEEATIEVVFDPAAHGPQGIGRVKRVIYITTTDALDKPLAVSFEANVVR